MKYLPIVLMLFCAIASGEDMTGKSIIDRCYNKICDNADCTAAHGYLTNCLPTIKDGRMHSFGMAGQDAHIQDTELPPSVVNIAFILVIYGGMIPQVDATAYDTLEECTSSGKSLNKILKTTHLKAKFICESTIFRTRTH